MLTYKFYSQKFIYMLSQPISSDFRAVHS